MGTKSSISIINTDGTVDSIYCHFNGHYKNNGRILFLYYNTIKKVKALIALGALSELNPILGVPSELFEHSMENPVDLVTIAYHRDRGGELQIDHFDSIFDFFTADPDPWYQFNYLWSEDRWYCMYIKHEVFFELTTQVIELDDIPDTAIPIVFPF